MAIKNRINDKYFDWLYSYMCKNRVHGDISYIKLFTKLHSIEFEFLISRDINRAKDGIDLHRRFAYDMEGKYDPYFILDELEAPCSVLEMMIALAIRCEETIMDDTRYGDRTAQWFWTMMNNMGLAYMTDDRYDDKIVSDTIYNLINRTYEKNGRGGLFYLPNHPEDDIRKIEIWMQLCWFLETI